MRAGKIAAALLTPSLLLGCLAGELQQNEAEKAFSRSAIEAVRIFESACLQHRRSPDRSLSRLKELGFSKPDGAKDGRMTRGGVLASARRDRKGVTRCFASSPVVDLAAIATDVHQMMTRRFPGAVTRGSAAGSPAWRVSPKGEPSFVVGVKAVSQGPGKPVLAIVTLAAPGA